jgi:hypothetical protein
MRRIIPFLLLLSACGSTPPQGQLEDPEAMGRPLELERREQARAATAKGPGDDTVTMTGSEPAQDERSSSRVLAYVNGEVITYRAVLLEVGPQLAVLGEESQRRELEQQALLDILRNRVVYHAALEAGVQMNRDQLDTERTRRLKDLAGTGGTLDAFLAERGMTRREFDEDIRREWTMQRFMSSAMGMGGGDRRVRPMVDTWVRPEDVRKYWERNPERYREAAHAKLYIMRIKADRANPDREAAVAEAGAKASEAHAALVGGEDWVPVYRRTVGPDVVAEDAYGLLRFQRGERAAWMEEFAFDNPKGSVCSEPRQTGTSFYVMVAAGSAEERIVPYDEVQEQVRQQLGQIKRSMASYEVELKLLERASVEPADKATGLREMLRTSRRDLMDRFGL